MEETIIRRYTPEDRQDIRNIAWDTAFMGETAGIFFSDREIFSDFLTLYFTDYEPESCFVAESEGKVIGYLIGAKDEAVLRKISTFRIIPQLFIKAIVKGTMLDGKNITYFMRCLVSFLKGEFRDPDFSKLYPAILHINLRQTFRNSGIGSRLMSRFLEYISKARVRGVHLATMSPEAGEFFTRHRFDLLYCTPRSYFRHILGSDIEVYVYGKTT